jgi:endonuclease YncB( thermonuclease family)
MKLFILCLLLGFYGLVSAQSDAKYPLVIVDGDSVNIDILRFLDVAQQHQEQMSDRTLLRMRISGIDTPEWNQTCEKHRGVVISCGELATKHLQRLLNNTVGRLFVKPLGVDYYDRILIRLFVGEMNIGKQMVLDGMAYSYGDTYLKEEALARKEMRGFWAFAKPPINPKEWRKNKNK